MKGHAPHAREREQHERQRNGCAGPLQGAALGDQPDERDGGEQIEDPEHAQGLKLHRQRASDEEQWQHQYDDSQERRCSAEQPPFAWSQTSGVSPLVGGERDRQNVSAAIQPRVKGPPVRKQGTSGCPRPRANPHPFAPVAPRTIPPRAPRRRPTRPRFRARATARDHGARLPRQQRRDRSETRTRLSHGSRCPWRRSPARARCRVAGTRRAPRRRARMRPCADGNIPRRVHPGYGTAWRIVSAAVRAATDHHDLNSARPKAIVAMYSRSSVPTCSVYTVANTLSPSTLLARNASPMASSASVSLVCTSSSAASRGNSRGSTLWKRRSGRWRGPRCLMIASGIRDRERAEQWRTRDQDRVSNPHPRLLQVLML